MYNQWSNLYGLYLRIVELALDRKFIRKKLVNAIESIDSNLLYETFKLIGVIACESSWVRGNRCNKICGSVTEELVKFFELFVHLRDGLNHVLYIQINDNNYLQILSIPSQNIKLKCVSLFVFVLKICNNLFVIIWHEKIKKYTIYW